MSLKRKASCQRLLDWSNRRLIVRTQLSMSSNELGGKDGSVRLRRLYLFIYFHSSLTVVILKKKGFV